MLQSQRPQEDDQLLWVRRAPPMAYDGLVSKVIQIRNVPDEVRDALAGAAESEGLSLTGYVRRELEHLARRAQTVRNNAAVVRQTQNQVRGNVERDTILSSLHEGRDM